MVVMAIIDGQRIVELELRDFDINYQLLKNFTVNRGLYRCVDSDPNIMYY